MTSQTKKDEARQKHINELFYYWYYYYQLRSLTLWDFNTNTNIDADSKRLSNNRIFYYSILFEYKMGLPLYLLK